MVKCVINCIKIMSYLEAQAKIDNANNVNGKILNNKNHFTEALFKSTSELYKQLTQNQDISLEHKK